MPPWRARVSGYNAAVLRSHLLEMEAALLPVHPLTSSSPCVVCYALSLVSIISRCFQSHHLQSHRLHCHCHCHRLPYHHHLHHHLRHRHHHWRHLHCPHLCHLCSSRALLIVSSTFITVTITTRPSYKVHYMIYLWVFPLQTPP